MLSLGPILDLPLLLDVCDTMRCDFQGTISSRNRQKKNGSRSASIQLTAILQSRPGPFHSSGKGGVTFPVSKPRAESPSLSGSACIYVHCKGIFSLSWFTCIGWGFMEHWSWEKELGIHIDGALRSWAGIPFSVCASLLMFCFLLQKDGENTCFCWLGLPGAVGDGSICVREMMVEFNIIRLGIEKVML